MTAIVLPFIARKPARTEAERACELARERMFMRLLPKYDAEERRFLGVWLREFEAEQRQRLLEAW